MNEQRSLLKDSLAAIERLQGRVRELESRGREPIAIVGAGCRFPGASDLQAVWRLLRNRRDMVTDVPADRWDASLYHDPRPEQPGKAIAQRAGFLEGIDRFDPQFFAISARESIALDPQHRLLLETAQEAIEGAGIPTDRLMRSRTGVFVGISMTEYQQMMLDQGLENIDIYAANGGALNTAAGRIAFVFGLEGPTMAVDTACSSSLVAVHLAVQSLRRGECDTALASGVNVILRPTAMIMLSQWGLMAPDGACKTFDDAADGFVRSEGCGTLLLKRLSDAVAADDPILAVIKGTAVNSDGRSSGLTVPHGPSQEAVIRSALRDASLSPGDIDFIEAHGTGTSLGDPIEIEAIGAVMADGHGPANPVIVGAVKPNLGHGEASAGMAGIFKIVTALNNEGIPPNIHFSTPSQRVDWSSLPVRVPTEMVPWPRREGKPRRAGVSGFGFSGTNAHLIIEEAPPRQKAPSGGDRPGLALVSARTTQAVRELAGRYASRLYDGPEVALPDVLATLAAGRTHAQRRVAFPVASLDDLRQGMAAIASGALPDGAAEGVVRLGEAPRVAFLFTGQGSQYPGMGRELYDREPVFRAEIDRCAEILSGVLDVDVRTLIFSAGPETQKLSETAYTQPALFAFEYALASLWRSLGLTPSVVAGHSVGEYVAACVAGVFSLEDALSLIATRGRMMQTLPPGGAMAAVFAQETDVDEVLAGLHDRIAKAAINGPEEIVVSGDRQVVSEVVKRFQAKGIETRPLDVSHAFHSPLLDPMLDAFERTAAKVACAPPRIPLVSNVTGQPFKVGVAPDAAYWRRHAREPVRFADVLKTLQESGVGALVEIGPQPTLVGLAARSAPAAKWARVGCLRRGRSDQAEINKALRDLHVAGVRLDWPAIAAGWGGQRIPLPTYAFQRERYWLETSSRKHVPRPGHHPLLGARQWSPAEGMQFLAEVSLDGAPWLADHVVLDTVPMPGAAYIEIALAAASSRETAGPIVLAGLAIGAPLLLEKQGIRLVHTEIRPESADRGALVTIRSTVSDSGEWVEHTRAYLGPRTGEAVEVACPSAAEASRQASTTIAADAFYDRLAGVGLTFGPTFRALRSISYGPGIAIGEVEVAEANDFLVHPALIDGAFHLTTCLIDPVANEHDDAVFVPVGIDSIALMEPAGATRLTAVAIVTEGDRSSGFVRADVRLERADGTPVLLIAGLQIQRITRAAMDTSAAGATNHRLIPRWAPVSSLNNQAPPRRLLMIADEGGMADSLARTAAAAVVVSREDLGRALRDGTGGDTLVVDLVVEPPAGLDTAGQVRSAYASILSTAKQIAAASPQAGYCVVTRGGQCVEPGEPGSIVLGGIPALMRALAAERSERIFATLDLDPDNPLDPKVGAACLERLRADDPMLAVRRGEILGQRLEEPVADTPRDGARRLLQLTKRGDLSGLDIATSPRQRPGPGEIEIEVAASGLNFRDVLITLGMVGDGVARIGSECAGVVCAVGVGVANLKVGDRVVACDNEAFGTYVTVSDKLAVRLPDAIGFGDAVTLPNAYLTAWLALSQMPKLGPEHTVLVHAAAGGVGLAAVTLAKCSGATVIGTAGSPVKRAFALEHGASHCFDSRSPSFRQDVLRVTGGKGVDLVLNSLTGDLIAAGLQTLKHGGIFVEIGKTDIWSPERLALEAPGKVYTVVDLGTEIGRSPARVRAVLEDIVLQVGRGDVPALPVRAFPFEAARDAFRFMANARHIGKVVLTMPSLQESAPIRRNGSYLVTGGLGGIGMEVARWLGAKGAGAIILAGRNSPDAERLRRIQDLQQAGTDIVVFQGDVADEDALRRLRQETLKDLPPLRGIFHAAGVLADAPFEAQDEAHFETVARPKVDAALRLHEFCRHDPIDMFVLFSSTSSIMGSAGQANYAAANGVLNALAQWRHVQALPATAVAWGAWAQVGMAANLGEASAARWSRIGIGLLSPDAGLKLLDAAIASDAPLTVAMRMNKIRFANRAGPAARSLLGAPIAVPTDEQPEPEVDVLAQLRSAAEGDRSALLKDFVRREVARVLGFKPAAMDTDTPLREFGFDSLMAVQVKTRVEADLGVTLQMMSVLRGPSIEELTGTILTAVTAALGRPGSEAGAAEDAVEWEEGFL